MSKRDEENDVEMGEETMAVVEKETNETIDLSLVWKNSPRVKKVNGAFQLDKNNPQHQPWFQEEDQK